MKRTLDVAALVLAAGAVVLMMLPTYGMTYSYEGGTGVRATQWYDFLFIAYFYFVPIVSLVCGVVMSVALLAGLLRGRPGGWVAIPGLVAAVLLKSFGYDQHRGAFVIGAGQWVAPLLGGAALLTFVSWVLARRAERVAHG